MNTFGRFAVTAVIAPVLSACAHSARYSGDGQLNLPLPPQERAYLAQVLLESLDNLPEAEVRQLWLIEAKRRAEEIDQGKVRLVSGDGLDEQVQSLFR